jgi:hypothetical protein
VERYDVELPSSFVAAIAQRQYRYSHQVETEGLHIVR